MGVSLQQFRMDLKQPWQKSLLFLAMAPLFPEYISFFLVIFSCLFAVKDIRQNQRKIQIGIIGKLLLAFIAYLAITVLYSRTPLLSLATVGMWIFFFLAYLIVTNLLTDTARFDGLLLCVTGVAGIVGLIACIQYRIGTFTNSNPIYFWEWLDDLVFQIIPLDIYELPYNLRAGSTFNNPNVLAEYLVAIAPFVVYFNFCERRKEIRLFCRICLFLTFAGVIFSFSRGGYIALLLLCGALIVLNIRHRFAAVSLYVFSALLFLPEEVVNRLLSISDGFSTGKEIIGNTVNSVELTYDATTEIINNAGAEIAVSERWKIWLEAFDSFLESPLFGYGAGVYPSWQVFNDANVQAVHAHNIVLQLLLEGGIIALILMLLLGYRVIRNGIELMRNGFNTSFWVGFALLGFAICFIVHGMVDYPLLTPKLICNFAMILGIAECSTRLFEGRKFAVRRRIHSRLSQRRTRQAKQPM